MYVASEIRNWVTLLLAVFGGIVGFRQYLIGQRQRRLENSFRIIDWFERTIHDETIEQWRQIFHAASEPAGASPGHFVHIANGHRSELPFSSLFTEGTPDNGAIERLAEVFDLIGHYAKDQTIDLRIVYFQLGQIMDTIHYWLNMIEYPWGDKTWIEELYPHYDYLYKELQISKQGWATKTYDHIA